MAFSCGGGFWSWNKLVGEAQDQLDCRGRLPARREVVEFQMMGPVKIRRWPTGKALRPILTEELPGQATLPQAAKETPTRPARAANPLGRSAPPELEGATKAPRGGEGKGQLWVCP